MSKSAPAELRLSSIFGLASDRAKLANWPEPTRKWGQLIKLFMTRLCCKNQTHTDTTHTHRARWWSMLMCVLCGFSAFSLLYSFSSASAFSVLLSFCPFVPLPSLPRVRVTSDLFLQCDAQRKWEATRPGGTGHTVEQTCCVHVLYLRIQSQLAMLSCDTFEFLYKENVNTFSTEQTHREQHNDALDMYTMVGTCIFSAHCASFIDLRGSLIKFSKLVTV